VCAIRFLLKTTIPPPPPSKNNHKNQKGERERETITMPVIRARGKKMGKYFLFVLKITLVSLLTLSSRKNETFLHDIKINPHALLSQKLKKCLNFFLLCCLVSANEKMAHRQQHNAPGKLERFILVVVVVVVVLPWLILEHSRTFTSVSTFALYILTS
jgi:hypothetical protein